MKATRRTVALLTGAALLAALVVVPSFWTFRQTKGAAEARQHTYLVLDRANTLLSALRAAESSQRAYLLTGDEAFLVPYSAASDSARADLEELRRLTSLGAAGDRLDALAPLVDARLAEMSRAVELHRDRTLPAAQAAASIGQGTRLMDSIRGEMSDFIRIEESAAAQHDAEFQSNMRSLFAIIVAASLLTLLIAVSFAYLLSREAQHRLKRLLHIETQQLLENQEETNIQLQRANVTLQVSEAKLAVTLKSIGDAVIATDAAGRVTLLNPLAEQLTGWKREEAIDRPVDEVVHVIDQATRQPSTFPVKETLAHGTMQRLAGHTVLISRDGSECAIADSCAPIRDRDGRVVGTVLVFRDVTREEAARQLRVDPHDSRYRGGRHHHPARRRRHRRASELGRRADVRLCRQGTHRRALQSTDTRA